MLFKDFLSEARLDEATQRFTPQLFEAINGHLAKMVAVLNARRADDASAAGVDMARLVDMITAIKVVGNRELRTAITKDDVGFDPNSADDLFTIFDKVPDSPKSAPPKDVADFFKDVAGLAPKVKKQETEELAKLTSSDEGERKAALAKLKAFSGKVDQLYNKLKTAQKG